MQLSELKQMLERTAINQCFKECLLRTFFYHKLNTDNNVYFAFLLLNKESFLHIKEVILLKTKRFFNFFLLNFSAF